MSDGIHVAKEAFECEIEGLHYSIRLGTTVRDGHPLLAGREGLFRDLAVDFEAKAPAAKKAAAPALKVGGGS